MKYILTALLLFMMFVLLFLNGKDAKPKEALPVSINAELEDISDELYGLGYDLCIQEGIKEEILEEVKK
jgi:hypothetical protein